MADSRPDTYAHIQQVQGRINHFIAKLIDRAQKHDASKLQEPELSGYDLLQDNLAVVARDHIPYGSPEYKALFANIKPAIKHHYQHNSHHPEHWENGVDQMTLVDLLEMVCDWSAAASRHGGRALDSMQGNAERFALSPQLAHIIENTLAEIERE